MSFYVEFSEWLMEQQKMYDNESIQKDIFSLLRNEEAFNLMSTDQKEILVKLLETSLSLSFILSNNKAKTDNLVGFFGDM